MQTEAVICACPACRAIQPSVSAQASGASTTPPGTTSQSQGGAAARLASGSTRRPARARTGAWLRATQLTVSSGAAPGR